jgi:tetratricopeptide (TPR) repeat protein
MWRRLSAGDRQKDVPGHFRSRTRFRIVNIAAENPAQTLAMHNAARALLFLIAFSIPCLAQELVYPRPGRDAFVVRKNVPYGDGLRFDLYRPAGDEIVPVVIFANVGISGMKDFPGYVGWGETIAASGLAAVHYEATSIDSFAALVSALRTAADTHRIDPSRIVVWGGSANVQVALPVAMDRRNTFIKGAVIYYGDANVPELRTDLPVYLVRSGLDDTGLNRRIDALAARALAANAPWTIESYGGGLHGFDIFNDNDVSRELIRRSIDFMKRVTTPALARAYVAVAGDAELGARFGRGEWAAAIEGYRAVITARPRDAEAHRRLGISLYEAGRYAEALPALEQAFALGRGGARDTQLPAARAATLAGNDERALFWLESAMSLPFITTAEIESDRALDRIRATPGYRNLTAGLNERRRVLSILQSDSFADGVRALRDSDLELIRREATLIGLAYQLLNANRVPAAIAVFTLATERYPDSANAWESLSEAEERAGRRDDALRHARKALELNPAQTVREAAQQRITRLGA